MQDFPTPQDVVCKTPENTKASQNLSASKKAQQQDSKYGPARGAATNGPGSVVGSLTRDRSAQAPTSPLLKIRTFLSKHLWKLKQMIMEERKKKRNWDLKMRRLSPAVYNHPPM